MSRQYVDPSSYPHVTIVRLNEWNERRSRPSLQRNALTQEPAPLLLNLKTDENETATDERQSPIDIRTTLAKFEPNLMDFPLIVQYPQRLREGAMLSNTGSTWKIDVNSKNFSMTGGPLEGRYQLEQLHAHWASTSLFGSEHTVDGQYYASEIHFVHFNETKYKAFGKSLDHGDGLSVLGVFLKVGNPHPELEKIISLMESVRYADKNVPVRDLHLDLYKLLPLDLTAYWTYEGSLTTPPYSECVIWIVLKSPIEVSSYQLQAMRTLMSLKEAELKSNHHDDDHHVRHNFRRIQPHNPAKVSASFGLHVPLGDRQQSPIDISTDAVVFEPELQHRHLILNYPHTMKIPAVLGNTGSTWKVDIPDRRFFMKGGPLYDVYYLEQFHAHWGHNGRSGSEHLVNGYAYAGEIHFVHWNRRYDSFGAACTKYDGLAVCGVFLEIGMPNREIAKLVDALDDIHYADMKTTMTHLDLNELLPEDTSEYYTYHGSLTTPPYNECVTWIVLKRPIEVSVDQLKAFQTLSTRKESERRDKSQQGRGHRSRSVQRSRPTRVLQNYRSLQRIQTREVVASFKEERILAASHKPKAHSNSSSSSGDSASE